MIHSLHGMGVVQFDPDNDGDRDIAISAANDSFNFYRNELQGSDVNWLRVVLDTSNSPEVVRPTALAVGLWCGLAAIRTPNR